MMRPYQGKNFGRDDTPALLLVGESHYLPEGATQHLSPDSWYTGDSSSLNTEEAKWINTAWVVEEAINTEFRIKSHSIFKRSFEVINDYGPRYSHFKHVSDDVAFYIFFLRPGVYKQSLGVAAQDIDLANQIFRVHFEALKPDAVVFLSRLAYLHLSSDLYCDRVIATPHPGCSWWNRTSAKYENRKGHQILRDFVCSLDWPQRHIKNRS